MLHKHFIKMNHTEEARYSITYDGISKEGDRSCNEDSTLVVRQEEDYFFMVADGLGGHGNGNVASRTVVDSIEEYITKEKPHISSEDETECFAQIVRQAQDALMNKKATGEFGDMMTTLVLLHIGEDICWCHVGDSRLYCFRKGRLVSQTLDHSVPQILVMAEEITQEEVRHHPDRNRLLRAMGKEWDRGDEFVVEAPIPIEADMAFLLCTDGFWEHILEQQMEQCLMEAEDVTVWLDRMSEIVKKNGEDYNMDNYSAIAVWIKQE